MVGRLFGSFASIENTAEVNNSEYDSDKLSGALFRMLFITAAIESPSNGRFRLQSS